MNSSSHCTESFSSSECQANNNCEQHKQHSSQENTSDDPVTKHFNSIVSESCDISPVAAMKMPSSNVESISLIAVETTKNNEIINNNNQQSLSPPEVINLMSEITDIVESHHESEQFLNDNNGLSNNDFSFKCETILFNKKNNQPQILSNNQSDKTEEPHENFEPKIILSKKSNNLTKKISSENDIDNNVASINELEQFTEAFLNPNYSPKNNKSDSNGFSEHNKKDYTNSTVTNNTQNNDSIITNDQTLISFQDGLSTFTNDLDNSYESSKPNLDDNDNDTDNSIVGQMFQDDAPIALLISKHGSCNFVERKISVCTPIKIGRAVARLRPSADNAVFDCKVLSRNHALLLYQEEKFYLRDAGSSNGTFINNVRLSNTLKKSKPHEIYSGDLLQFGVEVTEKKQVHNCVIAEIRLFHPDGTEVKKPYEENPNNSFSTQNDDNCYGNNDSITQFDGMHPMQSSSGFYLSTNQMIELSHFIKESMHKQSLLENQLESIKNLMDQARDSATQKWHSLIEEDLLMSRIEILQDKIVALTMSKSIKDSSIGEFSLEDISKELNNALNEKEQFELKMKSILQNLIEEKALIYENLSASEKSNRAKDLECDNLKNMLDQNYKNMQELVTTSEQSRKDFVSASSKIKLLEITIGEYQNKEKNYEFEKNELVTKINTMLKQNDSPSRAIEKVDAQTDTCFNDSSHFNGDIQHSHLDRQDDLLALNSIVSNLQTLYLKFSEDKSSKNFHLFDDRLAKIEKFLQSVKSTVKMNNISKDEKCEALMYELEIKQKQNELFIKDNLKLCSQIDEINHEMEKYKIDLQTLQSQQASSSSLSNEKTILDDSIDSKVTCSRESQTDDSFKTSPSVETLLCENDHVKLDSIIALWPQLEDILNKLETITHSQNKSKQDIVQQMKTVIENNTELLNENQSLIQDVDLLRTKLRELSDKNELSFLFAVIPLFVFIMALVLGFYPFLSSIMATSGI